MEHSFNVELATKYGILEAILLKHIYFWVQHNTVNQSEHNFHAGMYWTYNSVKAFEQIFPYATGPRIRNALHHLIDEGLIITGNFNQTPYNRTLWYTLTEKGLFHFVKQKMDLEKPKNRKNFLENQFQKTAKYTDIKHIEKHIENQIHPLYSPQRGEGTEVLDSIGKKEPNPSSSSNVQLPESPSSRTSDGSSTTDGADNAPVQKPSTALGLHSSSLKAPNQNPPAAAAPPTEVSTPVVEVVSSSETHTPKRYSPRAFEKKYPYLVEARNRILRYLSDREIKLVDIRALNRDIIALCQKFLDLNDEESAAIVITSYIDYLESPEYEYQVEHARTCPRITCQQDIAWKYDKIRAFKNDPSRHFDPTTMLSQ